MDGPEEWLEVAPTRSKGTISTTVPTSAAVLKDMLLNYKFKEKIFISFTMSYFVCKFSEAKFNSDATVYF